MKIKKGDYVLAVKYESALPRHPWFIGPVESFFFSGLKIEGSRRRWQHVLKISQSRGDWILENMEEIEMKGESFKSILGRADWVKVGV